MEIAFTVAASRRRFVRTILGAEALQARPRLNQRAVDREVLIRQKVTHFLVVQKLNQELVRHFSLQQPLAVLREH